MPSGRSQPASCPCAAKPIGRAFLPLAMRLRLAHRIDARTVGFASTECLHWGEADTEIALERASSEARVVVLHTENGRSFKSE